MVVLNGSHPKVPSRRDKLRQVVEDSRAGDCQRNEVFGRITSLLAKYRQAAPLYKNNITFSKEVQERESLVAKEYDELQGKVGNINRVFEAE